MKSAKFVASRAGGYVDEIGTIDAQVKALLERREVLIAKLEKRPLGMIVGEDFKATVFASTHTSLNYKRVKRLLGLVEYGKCWKTTKGTGVRVTKVAL